METNSEMYRHVLKRFDSQTQYLLMIIKNTYVQSLMRFTAIRDNIYDLHSSLFNMISDEQMNVLLKKQKRLYYITNELYTQVNSDYDLYLSLLNSCQSNEMLIALLEETKNNLLTLKREAQEILKHMEVTIGYIGGFRNSLKSFKDLIKNDESEEYTMILLEKEHDCHIYMKMRKSLIKESKRIYETDKQWNNTLMRLNERIERLKSIYE